MSDVVARILAFAADLPPVDDPLPADRYLVLHAALVGHVLSIDSEADFEPLARELIRFAHQLSSVTPLEPTTREVLAGRLRAGIEFVFLRLPEEPDERLSYLSSRILSSLAIESSHPDPLRQALAQRRARQRVLSCAADLILVLHYAAG